MKIYCEKARYNFSFFTIQNTRLAFYMRFRNKKKFLPTSPFSQCTFTSGQQSCCHCRWQSLPIRPKICIHPFSTTHFHALLVRPLQPPRPSPTPTKEQLCLSKVLMTSLSILMSPLPLPPPLPPPPPPPIMTAAVASCLAATLLTRNNLIFIFSNLTTLTMFISD